jgi:hypothetical protein
VRFPPRLPPANRSVPRPRCPHAAPPPAAPAPAAPACHALRTHGACQMIVFTSVPSDHGRRDPACLVTGQQVSPAGIEDIFTSMMTCPADSISCARAAGAVVRTECVPPSCAHTYAHTHTGFYGTRRTCRLEWRGWQFRRRRCCGCAAHRRGGGGGGGRFTRSRAAGGQAQDERGMRRRIHSPTRRSCTAAAARRAPA